MELQFEYKILDEKINKEEFFEKEGNLPFDGDSKIQMEVMMQEICDKLALKDEYLIKKLEVTLKYDLPFFAANRRLAKNWILENFIF
ncbi:hypothetical protein [Sulfurospirillum arcachonense]|uniref:hypothetical protein n=1 Tax=Sulfurospirillum arcachonense TaxID=57666 RepID=UPI000468ADF7|nr:hypothetical protein [Sulfurospirillum arcachonense]